ncbi:hypothetical protein L6R50_27465 [Myxococcota bacterium]|nr:hypothetical protein [Myxococcota bacterium]
MSEPSRVAKRKLLQLLVHEMGQTCKVVLDPLLLGPADEHCIPDFILQQFAHGVPLDLNPRYPLELDIDSDPQAFYVSLSFRSVRHRCRVPWRACGIMGVGFLGVNWEHEETEEVLPPVSRPQGTPALRPAEGGSPRVAKKRDLEPPRSPEGGGRKRTGHLKLVK